MTRDPAYLNCFSKTLSWLLNHQIDWQQGEWFTTIDERGQPSGDKGYQWKTPYHAGRATIRAFGMNRPDIVRIRRVWAAADSAFS